MLTKRSLLRHCITKRLAMSRSRNTERPACHSIYSTPLLTNTSTPTALCVNYLFIICPRVVPRVTCITTSTSIISLARAAICCQQTKHCPVFFVDKSLSQALIIFPFFFSHLFLQIQIYGNFQLVKLDFYHYFPTGEIYFPYFFCFIGLYYHKSC